MPCVALLLLLAPALLLQLLLASSAAGQAAQISYSVDEETAERATVGNVRESLGAGSGRAAYKIVPASRYFTIDSDGNVKIIAAIDRENSTTCPEEPCVIEFNAFSSDRRLRVRVTVNDINDNDPSFKELEKILSIEEGDSSFRHPLDLATDPDAGDNGMSTPKATYHLADPSGVFKLEKTASGFLNLQLQPGAAIDFERERQYNLTLTACDAGSPQRRCSRRPQLLVVQVKDRNDNEPNVTNVVVREVTEDMRIGGEVARILAHDLDSGSNAELRYFITDPKLARQFDIDSEGRITLRRQLNAKIATAYRLPVRVMDSGTTARFKDVKVNFEVKDINDHSPSISVVPMQSDDAKRIAVAENSREALLALVQVSDDDLGDNGRTQCQLAGGGEQRSFRLEASERDYLLHLAAPFDFEETPSQAVRIVCHDFGRPRRTSSKRVVVHFTNVNEFAPSFGPESGGFYTSVPESFEVGRPLFTFTSVDEDRDDRMTFSLDDSQPASYFVVDNQSSTYAEGYGTAGRGRLALRRTVDRDVLAADGVLKFVVFVTDSADASGERRTASATMTVSVGDVNDNAPSVQPPLVFEVAENEPRGTRALSLPAGVQRLRSSDADSESVNTMVSFSLGGLAASQLQPNGSLRTVTFDSPDDWPLNVTTVGEIRTCAPIDREQYQEFRLAVVVTNRAASPQLSSTTFVTVQIADKNDNKPRWYFPNASKYFINITAAQRLHEEVTRVEARDADLLSNVTYTLSSSSEFFSVDRVTGQVRVRRRLPPGRHELHIRADDNVNLNHPVYTTLVINVFQYAGQDSSQINLTIIVAMIVVTCAISVGLVFAIVCVRRRSQSFLTDKEQCHCHCSLPDCDAVSPDPLYSHLCTQAPKYDRQFPMTTFNHNNSAYDLRPQLMEQQLRNEVVVNQQDLDGDSADSGRGGSEDDHGGHLVGGGRQLHAGNSGTLPRRVMSPPPSLGQQKPAACQCLGIPEEDYHGCNDCGSVGSEAKQSVSLHVPADGQSCGGGSSSSSFLPPPVPPHGVEYRGHASLGRQWPQHPPYNPFHSLEPRQQQQQQQQQQQLLPEAGEPDDSQRMC